MNDNDLISRKYVLQEYDRQHQGPPGGARKIMEEAPTIPAIPVEWLRNLCAIAKMETEDKIFIDWLIQMWHCV